MKKKSLFLSLCFGGIAILFLAIFAIVSIIPPKGDDPNKPNGGDITAAVNNGNNKGSKEDPYYIYDTETFKLLEEWGGKTKPVRTKVQEPVMVEMKDENGNVIMEDNEPKMEEKRDEEGNIVYQDKLDENGYVVYVDDPNGATEVYHFKFLADVDFSGKEFIPLFNKGAEAEEGKGYFIGNIDGDGKIVKNISISVTKANFSNFKHKNDAAKNEYSAYIGVFGFVGTETTKAVISNITFDNISVSVEDSLIPYLKGSGENINDNFGNDFGGSFKALVVGGVAAYAENAEIKANVNVSIDSDSYAVYAENTLIGISAIGGVVAFAKNVVIADSKVNANIVSNGGNGGHFLGGVTGNLFSSTVSNVEVTATITTTTAIKEDELVDNKLGEKENLNTIKIGGVSGLIQTSTLENLTVTLNVSQTETQRADMSEVQIVNDFLYNKVGGVAAYVYANNSSEKTEMKNITVTSNVKMDCIFGGAIYEVASEDDETDDKYVNILNLVVKSDVNVIKASGVGELLYHTNLEYNDECKYGKHNGTDYNIMITGDTTYKTNTTANIIVGTAVSLVSKLFTQQTFMFVQKDLKIIYSGNLSLALSEKNFYVNQYGENGATKIQ